MNINLSVRLMSLRTYRPRARNVHGLWYPLLDYPFKQRLHSSRSTSRSLITHERIFNRVQYQLYLPLGIVHYSHNGNLSRGSPCFLEHRAEISC